MVTKVKHAAVKIITFYFPNFHFFTCAFLDRKPYNFFFCVFYQTVHTIKVLINTCTLYAFKD